ncbi:ser/Thr protein phosphatase family [Drepanopeziza brunnea f. sp. 'multigermtubi' MB_m1]|uniref:Ser/Thr protein phosphatase family n=1 Tax=Marssonina brunnea f. sp. multigermtubi (strain MB_m1) TaxID=1072389 RepID=K1XIX7_MARBU|nr:ser/Thr protein phosphatase family [Drepanopeziza brunnea f. sp. 'multigermtubi' MB_m1]EKD12444.1 ser/Thr protein phosphatase family [Drepanopeziza brunnea f. sp. 'multigermtubi' MB_m1]
MVLECGYLQNIRGSGKLRRMALCNCVGDLHDGAGLSDAVLPNGVLSNPIFEEIDCDVLTIGNHELYVSEIADEQQVTLTGLVGEKCQPALQLLQLQQSLGRQIVTSNVQILNPVTGAFDYIGSEYRYFSTAHGCLIYVLGLRIMTFGFLFDFTGNSNVSKVIKRHHPPPNRRDPGLPHHRRLRQRRRRQPALPNPIGNASFPADGSTPAVVHVVFFDYFASTVVQVLNRFRGGAYTMDDVAYYVNSNYTAQNYLPDFARLMWQANVPTLSGRAGHRL